MEDRFKLDVHTSLHFAVTRCRYSLTRSVTATRDRSSCRRRRRGRWRMWRRRRRRPAGFLCYAHQLLASLVLRDPNTAFISTHIVID